MNAPVPQHSSPSAEFSESLAAAKRETRREIKARLRDLAVDRAESAAAIYRNLASLPAFRDAAVLGVYLDFGTEAPIRPFLPTLFFRRNAEAANSGDDATAASKTPRTVAVPFCDGPELRFYRIDAPTFDAETGAPVFSNLEPGAFGILEPTAALRSDPNRAVAPSSFDVLLVPGLAFDANGGRLGRGAGFYDRFLPLLLPKTRLFGIAFDAQIVNRVPTTPLDFAVDAVVTPTQILTAALR